MSIYSVNLNLAERVLTPAAYILPFLATRDIKQTRRIAAKLEEMIICDLGHVIPRTELASLAKIHGLRDLRLKSRKVVRDSLLAVPWMTDSDCEDWLCFFPDLRVLRLDWTSNDTLLTADATASLAHRCPDLISLTVLWHHNLSLWMASPPLFHNLESIGFKSIGVMHNE